jgi:serine/threonine-protein kinase
MGTPEYMAPEQASGQEIDHRSDQYALGCILYEALTGQVPFRGENAMQTLTKHVFDALTPPSRMRKDLIIPPSLEAVVVRTLEKKREDRYQDMDAMYAALEAILPALRGIEVPASARTVVPTSASDTTSESAVLSSVTRRRTGALTLGALGAVVLAVAVFFIVPHAHRAIGVAPAAQRPLMPKPTPPQVSKPAMPQPIAQPDATVELALSSVPTGSEVYLDDELLGTTPITVKRPREAEGKVSLIFRKAGFKDTERVVPISANGYVVVELTHEVVVTKKVLPVHATPVAVTPTPTPVKKAGEQPNRHNTELRDPFGGN